MFTRCERVPGGHQVGFTAGHCLLCHHRRQELDPIGGQYGRLLREMDALTRTSEMILDNEQFAFFML